MVARVRLVSGRRVMWVGVGLPGWAVGGITVGGIAVGGITVATVLFGANVLFLQPMVVVGVVGVVGLAVDWFGRCVSTVVK